MAAPRIDDRIAISRPERAAFCERDVLRFRRELQRLRLLLAIRADRFADDRNQHVNVVSASTTDAQMRSFESPAARNAVNSPLPARPPSPSNPPISAE